MAVQLGPKFGAKLPWLRVKLIECGNTDHNQQGCCKNRPRENYTLQHGD